MPLRTLLAGFGPFGNVVSNPTERVVCHFARTGVEGHTLTTLVLPVSFERAAAAVARALTAERLDCAVLTGVAATAHTVHVERTARNLSAARIADCDGHAPQNVPVVPGGPERLYATVDVERVAGAVREAGLPVDVSDDAGGYVCNHTYYAALHTIVLHGLQTRCVFVHVPADELTLAEAGAPPAMVFTDVVRAVGCVLGALAVP